METNAGNQRVKVELHDPSVNSWDPATYCNPTSGPGQEEYHVLVKAGQMWLQHAKCRQFGKYMVTSWLLLPFICLRLYKWSKTMVPCPIAWEVFLPTPRRTNRHVLFFLWPQSVSRLDNNGIQLQPVQHNASLFSYVIYRAIKNYIILWQNIGFNISL